ncbi:FAD-dependent pyridine nucleotide-disulfide oxidoreductase [Penicillium cf. griseofulvum]|uniref:FAD-dependent pyridine nucleotide-disulfide oxidoreductase n=1 Tax=Penicillium cf. griseofulvum TaxID=2972120 RepID=A0A9W9JT28_9EURO|nr:FAD-dependent pyridine nucleotide-disulfide oxidoreductase [Penicillium cf. griseofulvum]KAJ5442102.1 FAD-dependent pyridine nucleotide-disulfide oxidoreductase [Penicillium cf. griseofulvum]KAJ5450926.1 FAD-dependent pyridine nucleotide-disulfide oxidoreductase [Penicillium cf. griseofulvum]
MSQKIVIIGAGFAGVWSALSAKRLLKLANKENEIEVVVIAPEPILVMRPRLYESNASSLVHPLETLFGEASIKFIPGIAKAIYTEKHTVDVRSASGIESTVAYDRLILAAGSSINRPEGVTGLQEYALDIDSLDSAVKLESHLERLGELPASSGRNTVVVCGAGFTGVELAAELPRRLGHLANARVILVGNADEVAPDFGTDPRLAIAQALTDLGVEFKLGSGVSAVDPEGVTLATGERIETKTAIWTAGVRATPLTTQIPGRRDTLARLYVDQYLRVSSVDDVFATGDAACAIADGKSQYALMSCQHANQLGRVSGYNAAAALLGEPLMEYSQAAYNCCLDLGPWGALVASSWDREKIRLSGDIAKRVKCYINQKLIYPPDNLLEALTLAEPVDIDSDKLFEQLTQVIG